MAKISNSKKNAGVSKPDYSAGNVSRTQNEVDEGHKVTEVDAPESRYQTKQQEVPVSEALEAKTDGPSFLKKKQRTIGGTVKQEVASRVATSTTDFSGPQADPSTVGLRSLSYSGDSGTLLGSAANTPSVGKSDRNPDAGRFERKLDQVTKRLNYASSEQTVEEYDTPVPLAESGSEGQGYYGTPKNTSARSQKSTGCHPADPLYQRSLDEITNDSMVFINGQYVRQSGVSYEDFPTKTSIIGADGRRAEESFSVDAGNYAPNLLRVTLGHDSGRIYLKKFEFPEVVDASITADQETVNLSSSNFVIDMNKAEIARQSIDSKAGRETELNWSPLGRAIPQPSQTIRLLQTIESETGATIAACYRFACKSHSYQLNKAAKDGQHTVRPVREMLTGAIGDSITSADYANSGTYGFNPLANHVMDAAYKDAVAARKAGSAATLILLHDSAAGYNTKADVLVKPKSLRQYIQVADNNMNVFRLKKEFGAAINAVDVFSTIDREYDPLLPVCVTDKIGLIYTLNPQTYAGFEQTVDGVRTYQKGKGYLKYAYSNRSSNYNVNVYHPLWNGIAKFIEQNSEKLFQVLGGGNSDIVWNIPLTHNTKTFSLFDFLVLASVPFIQKERINSMRDVLDFEVNFGYPFDLISISEFNPTNALNYSFSDIDHPLQTKIMHPATAVKWVMPEFSWGIGENTDSVNGPMYVAPWYFNEHQFIATSAGGSDGTNTGATMRYMSGVMSMPIIRSGVRLAYLDSLYSMSERDLRLCLDRLVSLPGTRVAGENSYAVYKYSQQSDGLPVFKGGYSIQDYLSSPRELGWFMDAPHGFLRNADNLVIEGNDIYYADRVLASTTEITSQTSFRAYAWYGKTSYDSNILGSSGVNIDRAQAFMQNWDCSPACRMLPVGSSESVYKARREVGFLLSFNDVAGVVNNVATMRLNQGYFHPFTTGLTDAGTSYGLQHQLTSKTFSCVGIAKALWGRVQKLPMAISPWDTCNFTGTKGAQFDPYDFIAMFGLAGTMSSDYNEDLYNRMNEVQNKGYLFTSDPFVSASPLFKDSIKYTL